MIFKKYVRLFAEHMVRTIRSSFDFFTSATQAIIEDAYEVSSFDFLTDSGDKDIEIQDLTEYELMVNYDGHTYDSNAHLILKTYIGENIDIEAYVDIIIGFSVEGLTYDDGNDISYVPGNIKQISIYTEDDSYKQFNIKLNDYDAIVEYLGSDLEKLKDVILPIIYRSADKIIPL